MTPKEKAEELVNRFNKAALMDNYDAKQCALIAVDEILKDREVVDGMRVINDPYWSEVKQELLKL